MAPVATNLVIFRTEHDLVYVLGGITLPSELRGCGAGKATRWFGRVWRPAAMANRIVVFEQNGQGKAGELCGCKGPAVGAAVQQPKAIQSLGKVDRHAAHIEYGLRVYGDLVGVVTIEYFGGHKTHQ